MSVLNEELRLFENEPFGDAGGAEPGEGASMRGSLPPETRYNKQ